MTFRPLGWTGATGAAGAAGALGLAWLLWAVASGPAGLAVLSAPAAGRAAAPSLAASAPAWTVYHGDPAGSGVAVSVTAVVTRTRAWTSPALDGQIYGEPLAWAGRVYVATENDTVYALSPATGAVVWSAHLGTPVPAGSVPCGNIAPVVGITGTPVIDRSRNEIFVVAAEMIRGAPAHLLVGLGTASGNRELSQDIDPAGAKAAALLQRTGLTLDAGRVVFGFGGNFGDCSSYRGRVVAVPETGGTPRGFTVDAAAGESQGAIWMGGAAPAVDSAGHVWVTAGNGSVRSAARAYDNSDSVLELSSSLRLIQYFAPGTWASDNAGDLDMSTEPALLSDGQVVASGKSGIVYLLNGARLGGIGGQQAALGPACGGTIAGGAAVLGRTVYLPCLSGIIAVRAAAAPAGLRLLWRSGTGGGPPIVAAGLVWTIGQDGVLYGLDPATGRIRQQAPVGVPANHFPTPSAGDGLLLAPAATRVVAFTATGGAAAATARAVTTPGTTPATRPGTQPGTQPAARGGALPAAAVYGGIAGGVALAGAAVWLVRRRRRSATQ